MDLLTGSLWDKVLLFTLPIVATNILQQLFNTADIAVVGQVVGNAPLAAVGCSGPIVTLFITLFSGLAIGANAVISRHIGAGDKGKVREAVHVSMAIAIIFGLLVMVVGESITRPLLEIVGTPANVMNLAVKYLRIYFLGSVFLMLYNFEAAILRAGGDTRKPVLVLIVTGAVNIVLNLFFVIVCRMNVEGVALATLISNVLSAFILLRILTQSENILQIRPKNIHLQKDVAKVILLIGIPAAIQGMLFNIANIVIQSGVNSLGSDVVAGSTVGFNIEIFVYYIVAGFGQASITFNSQNLGAGNLKRCAQATRWCVGLGFIMTVIVSCLIIGFREFLAGFFTSDETVIRIAVIRIMVLVSFEIFNMLNEVMSGTLRGLGYSILPAFLSIFFVCGVRILWLLFIFPLNRTFEWLITVYPLSWIFTDISLILAYFLVKKRLYTQRIKEIEV
ncbi:MAG: MATE family efflux transporter [Lachnospiraceae bacterium]|nr:MATE family efflux transporter [Lachnospiraceae bacterium]